MIAIASWVKLLTVPGPPPGPCEAKAALAHNRLASADVAAKTNCDTRCAVRDDAMAISCNVTLSEDRDDSVGGFENWPRESCRPRRDRPRAIRIHQSAGNRW